MDSPSAGPKSGGLLKSVFPLLNSNWLSLLKTEITVKSSHSPTQYQNTSYPTSLMGTTQFSNWEDEGLFVLLNHQLAILRLVQNIICLSVHAPDIAESTLKCIVTETSISFCAYAREYVIHFKITSFVYECNFCDVSEDMRSVNMLLTWIFMQMWSQKSALHLFSLFILTKYWLQALEKHLTEQYFTIILPKKQMDAQYWPRLQKMKAALPYVGSDFKWQWGWEGDESDGIISGRTDIDSWGMDSGKHSMQVIILPTGAKVQYLLIEKRQRSSATMEYFS